MEEDAGRGETTTTSSSNSGGPGSFQDEVHFEIRLPKLKAQFNASLYGEMVRTGFSSLYGDEALSDITLLLGNERLHAHKIVLGVWSDRFDISQKEFAIVGVDEADRDNFKLLLKHLYTGETDFITNDNIMSLIRLCCLFGIDTLKETCGELLGALVSDDNLFFLLDIIEKYKVKQLEAACGEHLAENFGTLLEEDKLIDLEPSTWAEMLRSDDLRIKSEEQLFDAVLRYANTRYKGDKEKRDQALTTILPFVRFPFLSPKFLMKNVEGDKTIADLPVVHDLLHETYRYKVYPSSIKTIRTRPRKGFIFDEDQLGTGMTLSEDKTKVTLTAGGTWANARSLHPLTEESDYCEWKIEYGTASQIMVGVVQGACASTGYAGQYANGWSYYSAGQIYHAGSILPSVGQQYATGDVIGMHLDFKTGNLTFYKNGVETCVAKDLPVRDTTSDGSGYFPIVSINSMPNSVSLVSRPTYPEALQIKAGKKQRTREPKTYRIGNDLDQTMEPIPDVAVVGAGVGGEGTAVPHKPSDPTSFIKRFLKF